MKKKILGLALALVMIIGLLPMTAFAADTPMPKVTVKGNGKATIHSGGLTGKEDSVLYIQTVDGQLVKVTEEPADNYMKFFYNKADNVLEILFKNINYKTDVAESALLTINGNSNYTAYYDVVMTLEGTNVIESTSTGNELSIGNYGTCTITGSGSLRFVSSLGSGAPINRNKTNSGELIIKDTTLYLENTYGSSSTAVIINNNKVTIENSDVTINGGPKNRGIITSTKWSTAPTNAEYGVTVKNSDFVYVTQGGAYGIETAGSIVFENSNVQMDRGETNNNNVFNKVPTLIGNYSEISWRATDINKDGEEYEWKSYEELGLKPGDALDTEAKLRHFKLVHECKVEGDDGDCTTPVACACGKEAVAAKEHAGVVTDCTKDTKCTNAGCTKIFKAAADAHVAGEDDGDCTTAIKCVNCDQIAVEAKAHVGGTATCTTLAKCETCGKEYGELAAHTVSRPDCSVDGVCSVCNQVIYQAGQHSGGSATCKELAKCESCGAEYGELAAHTGGTATCKDKAKCSVCGAEYGELTACAPAADDGDCTTAIKCSVCGKETTAAKDAHKYTDNADTACDNEGCTHTRKVEAPSTKPENNGNPQDGDNTALVLFATLMVASAAAFVCTKKFAVR